MSELSRQGIARPFIVSWAIDGALVLALAAAVLKGGQFVERLDTVVTNIESLSARVTQLETRPMGPGAAQRISVLEARNSSQAREIRALKEDITARLDRIENKMDRGFGLRE